MGIVYVVQSGAGGMAYALDPALWPEGIRPAFVDLSTCRPLDRLLYSGGGVDRAAIAGTVFAK